MNKDKVSLLLLARPDHSYTIYKSLLKSDINFLYCSFKLMPKWIRKFTKNPRIRYYSRNYSNCFLLTLFHLIRLKFHKDEWGKYEKGLYERHLKSLLKRVYPEMIHYWPNFSLDIMKKYKLEHPEVKTFAEVYFPCEFWVIDHINPVMKKFGLPVSVNIGVDAKRLNQTMEFEDNFIVPSPFVAETYKQYYPNKNYHIIPYGLTKWDKYKKKVAKQSREEITTFVYAGGVTIEKGCDLLLDYFYKHTEVELHIYGNIPSKQARIFSDYLKSQNIFYHGHVAKSLLQSEVSKYDVGIHLSRYDAYSLSVGEMMGAGLPVIVSDKTGICSTVDQIKAGVVTGLDEDSITKTISRIREPLNYNNYVSNLHDYLMSSPKFYEEEIVEFYKKQITNGK